MSPSLGPCVSSQGDEEPTAQITEIKERQVSLSLTSLSTMTTPRPQFIHP